MYKKPWIVCPIYVSINLPADKSTIALGNQWRLPDSNMEKLEVHPSQLSSSYEFPAGKTIVTWTATNLEDSVKSCNYHVYVKGELWSGISRHLFSFVTRAGSLQQLMMTKNIAAFIHLTRMHCGNQAKTKKKIRRKRAKDIKR